MPVDRTHEDAFVAELVGLMPHVRVFARSLCNDAAEADDLAQEALARALAARSKFTLGSNMRAWVYTILKNQFYSGKRRSWRSAPLDPEVAERVLVAVSNPTANLELDELRRAMAMLPAKQREALVLVAAGELTYDEASRICGVAVGTVKSRVCRARDGLALIYAEGVIVADKVLPSAAAASIFSQVHSYRHAAHA